MTGTPGDFLIGPGDITPPGGPSLEQESTVYIPPEPPGPTAEELADRAELEAAAAAAGLALEDYSDTAEGRSKAEEMGRRAEDRAKAAGEDIPPEPPKDVGTQASQEQISEWERGADGSLMPPANWAVDGDGGYVYSPPMKDLRPDQEAAAAGLSVAEWALTDEGRAHADAVEVEAQAQMAAAGGENIPIEIPESQSTFSDELLAELGLKQADYNPQTGGYGDEPPLTDEQISRAQANVDRKTQLRALDQAAWNVQNGTGIINGDVYGYNSLSSDGMARPASGA